MLDSGKNESQDCFAHMDGCAQDESNLTCTNTEKICATFLHETWCTLDCLGQDNKPWREM